MLDKKLKEQIYYGNTQQKKDFDNKAFYILVAVIIGFALILAVISINSNKTTHYELQEQERNLSNIVEKQTTDEKPKTKVETYTEAKSQSNKKVITSQKQTTNKSSLDNSMDEFYKINNTHASNNNNSLYGEFGSFVNDKTPQRTQNVVEQTVNKSSNDEIN